MATPIIVPITVEGELLSYDMESMQAIRGENITLRFDLTSATAQFSKFINAQGKDKVAPAYNLLAGFVLPEDKNAFENRLKNDHGAIMLVMGELADIILPKVEKAIKNFSISPTV